MFWQNHGIEKKDLLISASILLGSIIISLSICFSAVKLAGGDVKLFGQGDSAKVGAGDTPSIIKVVDRKEAPRIGGGQLEIVEFSDFQCPFCQQFFNGAYKDIKTKYIDTNKVKFIFRHYPLSFHKNAGISAEAAECANRQGKFWEYHDLLFAKAKPDGAGLNLADLKQYAKDLKLDTNKFNSCLDNGETKDAVKKDFEEGQRSGVNGTPTIFVGGVKLVGAQPFTNFEKAIEEALKK